MGMRNCGHQVGIGVGKRWEDVHISDADQNKDGIGPTYLDMSKFHQKGTWFDALEYAVHVTKYGAGMSEVCVISPKNPSDDVLDHGPFPKRRKRSMPGSNSLEIVYFCDGRSN